MQSLKEWLAYFKYYCPRVLSISKSKTRITGVTYLSEINQVQKHTLYIGKLSQAVYRFRMWDGISVMLVNDMECSISFENGLTIENKKIDCGNNNVIILSQAELEDIYDRCREFLKIEESVKEASNELLQSYLLDNSMQSILDKTAELIQNPMMFLDQSYRVIAYSHQEKCEDQQWEECIANGYCSYEFISRFNQLHEIRSSQKNVVPFFAGCMMSPMRRCIARVFIEKKQIGYLISIESSSMFNEISLQVIETSAKLLAKEMQLESVTGDRSFHSVWDILNDAIEGRKDSIHILQQHLEEAGFHQNEKYYLLRVNMEKYRSENYSTNQLNHVIRMVFKRCVFSYYENHIIILVESKDSLEDILKKVWSQENFIVESKIKVTISDSFYDLNWLPRNCRQTQRAMALMMALDEGKIIGTYDTYRRYDMMMSKDQDNQYYLDKSEVGEVPLFVGTKEQILHQYDVEHNTEYFKTAYVYSCNSRSLKETAEALHIHKNTISYRVSRLKELFDIDLNDARVRMNLCLAYEAFLLIEAGV